MAEEETVPAEPSGDEPARGGLYLWRWFGGLLIVLALAGGWAWIQREDLADRLIASELEKLDLTASYEVEEIGTDLQVLTNVVIGDPAAPDLTIERVEVGLDRAGLLPAIGYVRLVQPRLFGSYHDGNLSFGSLDTLLFGPDDGTPFALPDMVLDVDDGRGLIETDFGPLGAKIDADGNLRGGFAGILAVNGPELASGDCVAHGTWLYGTIGIDAERPQFDGPLRIGSLDCSDQDVRLEELALGLELQADRTLDALEGRFSVKSGPLGAFGVLFASLQGDGRLTYRDEALTARYDVTGQNVDLPQLAIASLSAEGTVRGRAGLTQLAIESSLSGSGMKPGPALGSSLSGMAEATGESLLGPMLNQIRVALDREAPNSTLAAELAFRSDANGNSLIMPRAELKGGSGATLLALSRLQLRLEEAEVTSLSANLSSGGRGLPRIKGRMEQQSDGGLALRLAMAEYRAGEGRLAVPELLVRQDSRGSFRFTGRINASGAIPGGEVAGLELPLSGVYTQASGLSMWQDCTNVSFGALSVASLELDRQNLRLCPPSGSPILAYDDTGISLAAGADSVDLSGDLGGTTIQITGGALGLAYPGILAARDVEIVLGEDEGTTRFNLPELTARIGSDLRGTFAGAEFRLAAVPLDVLEGQGAWQYLDGTLRLEEASLRVEDREAVDRFQPLIARNAELVMADNRIVADALLREPSSDREIVRTSIVHDLETGIGNADLFVDRLVFDKQLQPDMLTTLALGVVANAKGVLTGNGRIDWDPETITSGGTFATDDFDFAAVFGPVRGARGSIIFTDLLGLETAPNQKLFIDSVNPGIEATDGVLTYSLKPDFLLDVEGGRWPFLGGELELEPVELRMGVTEVRRYVLAIHGVDAARFIAQMELANLAATGRFDGRIPLVFDEDGGHIEQGLLHARPPGGNLSYIGGLTYEDMGMMANFAFDALKSLDYREMEVALDGPLEGEIVTKVRFDGIRQGTGSKKNFVTREIAKLPIRFNVNIRAPFYKLLTSLRAMYDPALIRDPRDLGLLASDGSRATPEIRSPLPAPYPPVQTPDSETMP